MPQRSPARLTASTTPWHQPKFAPTRAICFRSCNSAFSFQAVVGVQQSLYSLDGIELQYTKGTQSMQIMLQARICVENTMTEARMNVYKI